MLQPGAATTVRGGRAWRRAHLGVPLGGPADGRSHANANRLAGNADAARALEMTVLGATLRFHTAARVALCGAPFECNMAFNESLAVEPGDTLSVRGTPQGARCYLAVAGGLAAEEGAPLVKGQMLELAGAPVSEGRSLLPPTTLVTPVELRYTSPEPSPDLWFEVSNQANRRGIRLMGPPLPGKDEIITEGVNAGTIQVPPDGQPVILFYDQSTTGGYPKLGTIIRGDLPRVGQLRPRDVVRLKWITWEEAARLASDEALH